MTRETEDFNPIPLSDNLDSLNDVEKSVIESIQNQELIVANINHSFHDELTLGQKMADKVAEFGGSWRFIIAFVTVMICWVLFNTIWLANGNVFDPYPFILLNLVLSTLAAIQAPIIMMSQNRQTAKDRMAFSKSYEVNLKSELEIMRLHLKVDEILKKISKEEKA
ncbi:DUF1003 domain-containing protein [Pseudoalteromonas luteoviolacea]|uniref:DUF1003 domain-containing protein n=1 Tax=Pseudoalteromonas luteoviolacea TaxID=43657 RepID=UPI001154347C|nr:DUF1003 domain-containing protein [Pseudoalteromonas luteoviolacea]TQF71351.1 DUF1003 domain-containing protein [Pseudoalteromonas luteoviolacea]